MRMKTLGVVALIASLILMAGAATAYGVEGATTAEPQTEEQQDECEAMMEEMDDCPMADGGMMGMMHSDDMMEECEGMMDEMDDDTREACQEMMDEGMMDSMGDDCPMMGNGGMMG